MSVKIPGLLEVVSLDRVTDVLTDAFANYPKLMKTFPEKSSRLNALEATIRFYGQYDMHYGKAYTLDEDAFEIALILESKDMKASRAKCLKAGCYSIEYQKIKEKMSAEDRKKRIQLFNALEKLEKSIPMPTDFLYVDFLGVVRDKQGEGRGARLMEKICEYTDSEGKPIVLFTNTRKAAKFYENFEFKEIKTVTSEKFGFTNTYMIREPQ